MAFSWVGDGHVSGYDGATEQLNLTAGVLASTGCFDTNLGTRFQYALSDVPGMNLAALVPVQFTSSDGETSTKTMGMYVAPASSFASGHVPTPSEVVAAAGAVIYASTSLFPVGGSSGAVNIGITGPTPNVLTPGTKYWAMVCPIQASGSSWVPLGDPNVNGRGLSFWTNRAPAKPTITSPGSNLTVNDGGSFTLSFTPNDADAAGLSTSYNDDVAGVQVQYAPRATASNPNPAWTDLQIYNKPRNKFADGGFDSGIVGWGAGSGMASVAWSGTSGPYTFALVATPTTGVSNAFINSDKVSVVGGQRYWFGGVLTFNPLATDGRTTTPVYIKLRWYSDAAGTVQIGSDIDSASVACGISQSTNVAMNGVAPFSAVSARIFFNVTTADPAGGFHSSDRIVLDSCYANDTNNVGTSAYGVVGGGNYEPSSYPAGYGLKDPGWWIDGGSNTHYPAAGAIELWRARTITVLCGNVATPVSGNGVLPAGDWQIRMRTFDYGHPYPLSVRSTGSSADTLTPDSMPSSNTSPWSTAVNVSVLAEVPPPSPLAPINATAFVDGNPITFSWKYRNTHVPVPYEQVDYQAQIRKVGAADWDFLWSDTTADTSFTVNDTAPPHEYFPAGQGGFEDGTVDGWVSYAAGYGTVSLTSVQPHSGAFAGSITEPASPNGGVIAKRNFTVHAGDTRVSLSGWLRPRDASSVFVVALAFLNGSGGTISSVSGPTVAGGAGVWNYQHLEADIPAGTASISILVEAAGGVGTRSTLDFDDFSLTGRNTADGYWFEATNEYEWRVFVHDSNGQVSDWSTPARFWVIPEGASGSTLPVPSSTVDGATLGCGKHRVFVFRRGGTERVAEITGHSHVDWGRARDDISTSNIVVSDWDIDCGNLLASLQTWAYEVVIFRNNGFQIDRVWEGPITLITYEVDKVTIDAKDVMAYAYRRILKQAMSAAAIDESVVSYATRVLQNAFAPDDPNVLAYLNSIILSDDAHTGTRTVPPFSRTAFEEIDDMAANAGLDYVAVGRAVILWDTSHKIGLLPEFRDQDLGSPPIVSEYGMSAANEYAVSDGNGVYGEANRLDVSGNTQAEYGLVEMLSSTWSSGSSTENGTYTGGLATVQASFEGYAEKSIASRWPPPVIVRVPDNTTLNPDAPISIQQLVPGVAIPLRSSGTLRQVRSLQKLDSMKVVEESGNETVSITLSPFASEQALIESEGV